MQSMVERCQYNEYHTDLIRDVREKLLDLCSCQSLVIDNISKPNSIIEDQFIHHVSNLYQASQELNKTYRNSCLYNLEYALTSGTTIRSEDHLGHAFFIFEIHTIVRVLIEAATKKKKFVGAKKKKSLKERLIPGWPRVFAALKTTVIIGVGSLFILLPSLVSIFENGQWIMIALSMAQGDTVGGAFKIMRMRLFGTLLGEFNKEYFLKLFSLIGAMWAYITYLAVGEDLYRTFGMLVPWILFFGYIRLLPNWSYTAVVAIFTPIVVNLGRLASNTPIPEGNFVLLRIEENLIGIGLAIVLTLGIFPIFAMDLLKKDIQS
jgi:hypothetical protein